VSDGAGPVIRLGIAGLGQGGQRIVPAALRHPRVEIAAVAELRNELVEAFVRDVPCEAHDDFTSLAASPNVDLVYIATPTHLHAEHVLIALAAGKHAIVEKPMAVTLGEADAMIAAADANGVMLMVGHSQSFEPAVRAMRDIVRSGDIGPLRMMQNVAYTDWLYRPRTTQDLDTVLGGGVVYRQAAHQIDILRWIGGGMVRSVRASVGRWDPTRPTEGSHAMFLEFAAGVVATATYSGYDHFQTPELTFGVGEDGRLAAYEPGASRRALAQAGTAGESDLKRRGAATVGSSPEPDHASAFGLTIVSCEGGDIRQVPEGLRIYSDAGSRVVAVPATPTGRDVMLDEACEAVASRRPPPHDGRWGRATLEVCIAALESSRTRREVTLNLQAPASG
jgi:phthalate 4,5-cis-dihydrodiol dehydrogenase